MKHPKRKLIGGILLLLVLTGLFGGFLLISNAGGRSKVTSWIIFFNIDWI